VRGHVHITGKTHKRKDDNMANEVSLVQYKQEVCASCFDASWTWGERGYTERFRLLLEEGHEIQAHRCDKEIRLPSDGPTYIIKCSCRCEAEIT
jgi:hypothetical protein